MFSPRDFHLAEDEDEAIKRLCVLCSEKTLKITDTHRSCGHTKLRELQEFRALRGEKECLTQRSQRLRRDRRGFLLPLHVIPRFIRGIQSFSGLFLDPRVRGDDGGE